MKMNMNIFLLIFIIMIMKVVECDLISSPLNQNFRDDPFQDAYLQTIFRMDRKTLRKIPILDDDRFLLQLNERVDNRKDLIVKNNPTPADDKKLDDELISQRAIEETWEELVVAGPMTIDYVGNLMVLSSKQDFAFTLPSPNSVYHYIKHPNSFRTTLVQIANEIYMAFMGAHSNMDRIQLDMQQIPKHLKTVLQLLTSASTRLIQSMLPGALGHIERIAKQCGDAADSTMKSFGNVTALLMEVGQVASDTLGYNTNELKNISTLVNSSIDAQTLVASQLEDIRKRYEEARITLDKAREEYYKAYHAIPTRSKRFLGGFIGGVIGGFIGGIMGGSLGCIFSSCNSKPHPPIDNTAFQNAKETAELALEHLKEAEAKYDEWYTKMLEQQNTLAATVIQMSQLDMEKIDYKTTMDILVSALSELAKIRQQWANMTQFFTSLAIRAEATRQTILYEFIDTIKNVTLIDGVLDAADREFFVLQMLDVADDIDRGAHLLYIMSRTYYDVSAQYIINQIAGLSALAVIQTDSERKSRMQQLADDMLSTSAKVSRMALERKQQYEQRNQARQNEYKMFILQIMSEELESSIGK